MNEDEKEPMNVVAIKEWFAKNRPDIPQTTLSRLMWDNSFILMMTASFEAGRQFQREHPQVESGHGYLN